MNQCFPKPLTQGCHITEQLTRSGSTGSGLGFTIIMHNNHQYAQYQVASKVFSTLTIFSTITIPQYVSLFFYFDQRQTLSTNFLSQFSWIVLKFCTDVLWTILRRKHSDILDSRALFGLYGLRQVGTAEKLTCSDQSEIL